MIIRARVLIVACIVWILGVFIYFYTTCEGRDEYTYWNDAVAVESGEYLISGSDDMARYLFRIDSNYNVKQICDTEDFAKGSTIWEIERAEGYVYLLIHTAANNGPNKVDVFNVLKMTEDMRLVGTSGWFDFSIKDSDVADMTVDDNDVICITCVAGENNSEIFVYPIDATMIDSTADTDENNVRHVRTLNYTDYFESETGNTVVFASYEDGLLKKYEDGNTIENTDFYNVVAANYYDNKILAIKDLIYINDQLFSNCLAIMILGIATIISLYVMMVRRNRVAYLIFAWELMCVANAIAMIWINGRKTEVFIVAGVVFAVGSFAGIIILLLQHIDLSNFIAAMKKVSRGREDIFKPRTVGGDINAMWNALFDLTRAIKSMNYNMFRVYEGYYKFAPKFIEEKIGKDSIADVVLLDKNITKATLAMFHCRESISDEMSNQLFSKISSYQDEDKAAFLCANADATDIEIMFPEGNTAVSAFPIELNEFRNDKDSCMLIHYDQVQFKVLGDGKQNALSVYNPVAKELFAAMDVLSEHGVKCLMTKAAYEHELSKPLCRYIGHFSLSTGEDIEVYELLDVLPEREKRLKADTRELFVEAYECIVSKDYYHARNIFAKILKTNPADSVARDYLFKCEEAISLDSNTDINFGINR